MEGSILPHVGRHLIVDTFGSSPEVLNDAPRLEQSLRTFIEAVGIPILHTYFHQFDPIGVTGVFVLATSHATIHTWPEFGHLALDIFFCSDTDVRPHLPKLMEDLTAQRFYVTDLKRGAEEGMQISTSSEGNVEPQVLRGDLADVRELQAMLAGRHRILHAGRSPYQQVLLLEVPDVRLYLDQQLQFSSVDERFYHEALVHPAMSLAPSHRRILLVGGGDGLAVREILKYTDVDHVDLVDLDPMVLHVAQHVPEVAAMNEGALNDERVQVHMQDARTFLSDVTAVYDVIVMDLPDPGDEVLSQLYTREFFEKTAAHLAPDGVLVCQSYSPEEAPRVFWTIGKTMEAAGLTLLSYHLEVPSFGDWGFHVGARAPLAWGERKVEVACTTVPDDLTPWFRFPKAVRKKRKAAVVNSIYQLVLHDIYDREVR
ncbi:MAG: hypothetical protein K0R39_916 [Symbiobacteriaceae bacterium]|jgi:spermidine synthase|nr:hypothetical protein [Symbiobacteriaceae bacterium]